jgi:hypothetical protein
MGDRLIKSNWSEAVVAKLIPPACREEVLGDLHERNPSSARYLVDAFRTVPLVILSRIRRTFDARLFAMYAAVVYLQLFGEGWFQARWLVPDAIPTIAVLIVLALEEAYAGRGPISRVSLFRGRTLALAAALATEVILHVAGSDLALPWTATLRGSFLGLTWTLPIQMLFKPPTKPQRGSI